MPKYLSPQDYLQKTLNARVYDVAIVTPLQTAKSLSQRLSSTVLPKRLLRLLAVCSEDTIATS